MLIIRRIVEHLQDGQNATVIPPFNSPAVFVVAGKSQRRLSGCESHGLLLLQYSGVAWHSLHGCRTEHSYKLFLCSHYHEPVTSVGVSGLLMPDTLGIPVTIFGATFGAASSPESAAPPRRSLSPDCQLHKLPCPEVAAMHPRGTRAPLPNYAISVIHFFINSHLKPICVYSHL